MAKQKGKQFVVIGLGRFGASVARALYAQGCDVLAIDNDAEAVEEIADDVTHAVQAEATDEEALKRLGLRNFDVAVIAIGNDVQSSILAALLCKEMGIGYVMAKAQTELHEKVLLRMGVDRVVRPEKDMGVRVARSLTSRNIIEMIELSDVFQLVETHLPEGWSGSSLRQLNVRVRFGINIVAIRRGTELLVSPHGDEILQSGDELVVIGSKQDVERLERL